MSQKKKTIIPTGSEVWDYINNGYAVCNQCGALMEEGEEYTYKCPNCGWVIDQDEYVYDDGDPDPTDITDDMKKVFGEPVPPSGCIACGGPYPYCKTSCPIFDD